MDRVDSARGYSLTELMFVAGLIATLSGIAVPNVLAALDHFRASGAARYMSATLHRARMQAIASSADVGLRFVQTGDGYTYTAYRDGNRNGVLTRDIQRDIDRPLAAPERLPDRFTGVDFGVLPGVPEVDQNVPLGADPIRLGASNILTFTPLGSSSTGSLYIRSRDRQYVVRIFGTTGKTRVLRFNRQTRRWEAPGA